MKKIYLILSTVLLLLLAACDFTISINKTTMDNSSSTTNNTTTNSTTANNNPITNIGYFLEEIPTNYRKDYVTYDKTYMTSKAMEDKFNELSTNVNKTSNSIYESNYQQGLLDLFDIKNNVSLKITISNEELQKIHDDNTINKSNRELYHKCNLDITLNGLVYHFEEVGIRMKGNTSRGAIFNEDKLNLRHYKLSLTETFDDEEYGEEAKVWTTSTLRKERKNRNFFGLEKLDIRFNKNEDQTYIKELYAYEMYRANGLLAPHGNLMNVSMDIDGNLCNMGVYLGLETVDKNFLARNLKSDYATGDLYKCGWGSGSGATLNDSSDYLFGVENAFLGEFYTYDLKTNKKVSTHESIKSFINNLSNTSDIDNFISNNLYEDDFYKYLSVAYFLGDPDDFRGNYNNYYIYFSSTDNKAIFIPNDHDRVLGSMGGSNPLSSAGVYVTPFDNISGYGGETNQNLLVKSIFNKANSSCTKKYIEALEGVLDSGFMSIDKFNYYYNYAANLHSSYTQLSDIIKNSEVEFSIDEDNDPTSAYNLSVSVYFSKKLETYNNSINGEDIGGESIPQAKTDLSMTHYIRGVDGWSVSDNYIMATNGNALEITITISDKKEFKIYTTYNGSEYWLGYDIIDQEYSFSSVGDSGNISLNEAGTYKIRYDGQKIYIDKQ